MRLSQAQINDIIDSINSYLDEPYELFLVGSRTQDHLKGGDIDLLLIANKDIIQKLEDIKLKALNKIMAQPSIDDCKVDLILATAKDLKDDPFVSTLNDSKIRLSK